MNDEVVEIVGSLEGPLLRNCCLLYFQHAIPSLFS